jgi:competence protein ComEC
MVPASGLLWSLTYVLALLLTGLPWSWARFPSLGLGFLLLGVGSAMVMPRVWRRGPEPAQWILAGAIGLLATVYLLLRTPQPGPQDLSHWLTDPTLGDNQFRSTVLVQGTIDSIPHLNRAQKVRFWLKVQQARRFTEFGSSQANGGADGEADGGGNGPNPVHLASALFSPNLISESVTGRIYVTVPLLQGTDLYPGQTVEVTGTLYLPSGAVNPGGFDFRAYLARHGSFVGLRGQRVESLALGKRWGGWQVRRRIVQAQAQGLLSPGAPLVSAMVLGSRSVDLPTIFATNLPD